MPIRKKEIIDGNICFTCTSCKKLKPIELFHKKNGELTLSGEQKYRSHCIPCGREYSHSNWLKRKESGEHRRVSYKYQLNKNYNLSVHQFNEMYRGQSGACLICGKTLENIFLLVKGVRLAIDHCHKTGKVRGMLCNNCNSGIGKLNDDIEMLEKAIWYLKENG